MNLSIQNNMFAMNANRMFGITMGRKAKNMEKLSSGYRINRSADDAAGLTISEKMRRIVRGLNKGTKNAQDGISWVQIGDGALNEAHDMLHRMKELSIESLNDTYTDSDREMMQMEFDQLQSELDRLTKTTLFNEQNIFQEHQPSYYQFQGSAVWPQDQLHLVRGSKNDLEIVYRLKEADAPATRTITIPPGDYTTQALIDEIDTALGEAGLTEEGIVLEYTLDGRCNLNLEGGEKIDNVGGGLSYLLYDSFGGGSLGALLGTTVFRNDASRLPIAAGENDELAFTVVNTDGTSSDVSLKIAANPVGGYTRDELLGKLQAELDRTPGNTIRATAYGTGIKLASDESIITGFKGNMFKIDKGQFTYTSVFYDNVQESTVNYTPGKLTGAAILPRSAPSYPWDAYFTIRAGENDTLVVKPNGAAQETVVTIPTDPADPFKRYTMNEMINVLNGQLNPLGLEASKHSNGTYEGITITSTVKGVTSDVGIIREKSNAFDTLFVSHAYRVPGRGATYANQTTADVRAELVSGSDYFIDGASVLPLEITAGVNDRFRLNINDKSYTITLDAGNYASLEAIRDQIHAKLNGASAPADYKGLLDVTTVSGSGTMGSRIKLLGNYPVVNVTVSKVDGNTGYEAVFVGQSRTTTWSTPKGNGHTTATTNNNVIQPDGTVKISASQKNLTVYVDNVAKSVTLPVGDHVSQTDIIHAINNQVNDTQAPNKFAGVYETGNSVDGNFSATAAGGTRYTGPADFNTKGVSVGDSQGIAGALTTNQPATQTISKALPDKMAITGANKHFACTLNGLGSSQQKNISFDLVEKEYTRAELAAELQSKITAQCGVAPDKYGGLKVSLDSSNRLVFTAGLLGDNNVEGRGDTTQFLSNPGMCSFLNGLYEEKTAASAALYRSINFPVDFGSGKTFSFQMQKPGETAPANVSVTLTGSYNNGTALAAHMTDRLTAHGVQAAFNGGYLTLSTTEKGAGYKIVFDSRQGGDATDNIFGQIPPGESERKMAYQTSAKVSDGLNRDVQGSFTLDGSHNTFSIVVDGARQTVNLTEKTYNIDSLITELNNKLTGVKVGKDTAGNRLTFETLSKGTGSSISMQYDSGGTAMERIFGTYTVPGATAEFKDGHLEITSSGSPNSTVRVSSLAGGPFQLPIIDTAGPAAAAGKISNQPSYIQGAPVTPNKNGKVTIDQYNKDLTLRYYADYDNGSGSLTTKPVSLDEGDYTLPGLASALEQKLGPQFHVKVQDGGIRIESAVKQFGRTFRFSDSYSYPYASGGFYREILGAPEWRTQEGEAVTVPGGQTRISTFVMGRKDIRHQTTKIQKGVNDDLGLEFAIGNQIHPLKMTLDEGSYSADALLKEVQKKLDDALVGAGLPQGLIRAGMGGFTTGVAGSDDENALHFILSDKVALPAGNENDRCAIEAVSGKAAFSIFYQTEGDIARAYIEGTRDLTEGAEITDANNELSVEVDGTNYTIRIPPKADGGNYMPDELLAKINEQFKAQSVPLNASLEKGKLHLLHNKFGTHNIKNVSGTAKKSLFFVENGEKEMKSGISIQFSSEKGDKLEIGRPVLNTASMRINSVLISRPKYAGKALQRLDDAASRVSEVRSNFGAMQNRLEHAIRNNENQEENTAAAESRIRDADMAREMVEHARDNILSQVGMAMMAQAGQTAQGVLRLLENG